MLLDREGADAYLSMPKKFQMTSDNRGVKVLYAAGILERDDGSHPVYERDVSVVHASKLYPRLASKFPIDEKVRMLRADTGERIYF